MKNLDSIPHSLNGIFHELNNATNVNVTLTSSPTTPNPESSKPASGILDVNGFKTPAEYYHYLLSLCACVRLAIVDDLYGLDPNEKGAMLIEAFNRADTLLEKVSSVILPAETNEPNSSRHLLLRKFTNVAIRSDNKQITPPAADSRSLIIQLHPYACQLKKSISILSHQLISLATLLQHHQDICTGGPSPPPSSLKKLRIRGSVPDAATLGRILYDDGLFDIQNKSEFCRIFSACISTQNQENISSQSFKNHFNIPSSKSLTFWDTKISEWRKYIRELSILN